MSTELQSEFVVEMRNALEAILPGVKLWGDPVPYLDRLSTADFKLQLILRDPDKYDAFPDVQVPISEREIKGLRKDGVLDQNKFKTFILPAL